MVSLMDSFEQQYATLTAEITSKTSQIPNFNGVEKKMAVSQAERQMEEAHELLEQMDLEVKGMAPASRQKYQIRLKSYITELALLDKELQRSRATSHEDFSMREELFDGDSFIKDDQKQCLLDNTERLERSSRQLEGGYKLAIEAEQMGAQILLDLHSQKEAIVKSKERVRDTNYDIGKSSRVLSGMMRGMLQQRVILSLVTAGIVVTIVVAVYFAATKS